MLTAPNLTVVLLFHVSWEVITGIVDVDKSPINDWDRLYDVLEAFTVSRRSTRQSSENILNNGEGERDSKSVYSRQVMTVLE